MASVVEKYLSKMQVIYKNWLIGVSSPDNTTERIDEILSVFEQVSPPILSKFIEGMKIVDLKFRTTQDDEILLKLKLVIFDKYFTFNMNQLTSKITATLNKDTIDLLFTGRIEPVAVICQRIVVRQYGVINQRIEKRLKSKVDSNKFVHCDLCAEFGEQKDYERLSADTLRTMVRHGFHPHNIKRIVTSLSKRNKVTPDVIASQVNTQKWLDFVGVSKDVWRICDECLADVAPYY